jgi:hypothetical protein
VVGADPAGVDGGARRLHARAEHRVGRAPDAQARARSGLDHLAALRHRRGERLLDVHVLARREGGRRDVRVRGRQREDEHGVDVIGGEQVGQGEHPRALVAGGERRGPLGLQVAHGRDLQLR